MRVALTCDWFLKYAAAQAAGLARAGVDVLLLCRTHAFEFGGGAGERARTIDSARLAGVTVLELPGRLWDPRVVPALLGIRRQVARFAPDVIHVHDGADPRALVLLPRAPTVLTLHDPVSHPGQPVPAAQKKWFLHGSRDAWRTRARVIVVHSDRLRSELRLQGGQRSVVIAHGLSVSERALAPPPDPAVAFFGRLTPYKGLEVLARAMPRVWKVRPEVQLLIAGQGTSEVPLSDRRVRVQRRYLPESDVADFLRDASLIALPYTHATQTGVGSLAVGYGVPVVASRLGGLPDIVLDGSYLVEPGDEEELASAIVAHIDDGSEVRDRVLQEIARPRSWEAVARQALTLYEELVAAA